MRSNRLCVEPRGYPRLHMADTRQDHTLRISESRLNLIQHYRWEKRVFLAPEQQHWRTDKAKSGAECLRRKMVSAFLNCLKYTAVIRLALTLIAVKRPVQLPRHKGRLQIGRAHV